MAALIEAVRKTPSHPRDRRLCRRSAAHRQQRRHRPAAAQGRRRRGAAGRRPGPRRGARHRRHRPSLRRHHQSEGSERAWPRHRRPRRRDHRRSGVRPVPPDRDHGRPRSGAARHRSAARRRRDADQRARASASCWRSIRSPSSRRATSSPAAYSPRSPPAAAPSSMPTKALGDKFAEHFPTVYASCIAGGIDPARQPIPIAPAVHYHMGGVAVDARGRTSIDGLWAGGEVSSTGAHGANRLASNSLLEAVVFAARIAEDIDGRAFAAQRLPPAEVPRNCAMPPSARSELCAALMASHVGVVRDGDDLADAIAHAGDDGAVGRQHRAAQHGDHGADRRDRRLVAPRKPRRPLSLGLSGGERGAGKAHDDDAERGARRRRLDRQGHARRASAPRPEAAMVTPASLLHPEAFLSPMAVESAVRQALDEDLGRAGDITSIATIPEATQTRATLVARQAGVIAGLPLAVETFRQLSPDVRIETNARDGLEVDKGMQRADDRRPRPRRAVRRAHRAEFRRPPVGRGDADGGLCAAGRGHEDAHLLHAQDHAGPARAGEICRALRRRLQPPLRPRRRDPDQGQPHRGRRRRARGAGAGARTRGPSRQDRDRGRHARSAARGARHQTRRRRAARQHGHSDPEAGGGDGRGPRRAGSLGRRHRKLDRRDRRDRRRLCVLRRADPLGAEFRRGAGYRELKASPRSRPSLPRCPSSALRCRRPTGAGDRRRAGRSCTSSSSRAPSKAARRSRDSASSG